MKKRKELYFIFAILGTVLLLGGVSFAIFTIVLEGEQNQKVIAGKLLLELDEEQPLLIENAIPVKDEVGLASTPFTFSLENTGTIEASYHVYIEEQPLLAGETRLAPEKIKYELKINGTQVEIGNLSGGDFQIYESNIGIGTLNNFELRLWIDYDVTELDNTDTFNSKIRVEGSQELIPIPAAAPVLVGEMIPVIYDEAQSEWVKAQTVRGTWYNYDEQMWANAVTVTETNRETLTNASVGTVIPMDDINAMFVWIPRYSYTIFETGTEEAIGIDIKWINTDTAELGTAKYTSNTAENWYTHPAFCWGNSCDDQATRTNAENRELQGIWVAKFETSTTGGATTNAIQQPIVKPSVTSWRNVSISNSFYSIQQFMNRTQGEEIYGLSGSTYDTHMMKNTEWGAVAYLSQSSFGKYGNDNYIGLDKEVAINNCSTYVTGIGGDAVNALESSSTCTTNTYETKKGQTASTTGNIYGVYDMSGGAWEYVMGNVEDVNGAFNAWNSGFTLIPESKYYNNYAYGTEGADFTRMILGDATFETLGFYGDNRLFPTFDYPWFKRGGIKHNASSAGVFDFSNGNYGQGHAVSYSGFRITITP